MVVFFSIISFGFGVVAGMQKIEPCRLIHLDSSLADVNPECYVTWWPVQGYGLEHQYSLRAKGCDTAVGEWANKLLVDSGRVMLPVTACDGLNPIVWTTEDPDLGEPVAEAPWIEEQPKD